MFWVDAGCGHHWCQVYWQTCTFLRFTATKNKHFFKLENIQLNAVTWRPVFTVVLFCYLALRGVLLSLFPKLSFQASFYAFYRNFPQKEVKDQHILFNYYLHFCNFSASSLSSHLKAHRDWRNQVIGQKLVTYSEWDSIVWTFIVYKIPSSSQTKHGHNERGRLQRNIRNVELNIGERSRKEKWFNWGGRMSEPFTERRL